MAASNTDFFRAFQSGLPAIEEKLAVKQSAFKSQFQNSIAGLDILQATEYASQRLEDLHPDKGLCNLYNVIREFQDATFGEGNILADDLSIVIATADAATQLSGKKKASLSFVPQLLNRMQEALAQWNEAAYLQTFIQKNAAAVGVYRLKRLEEQQQAGDDKLMGTVSSTEYTSTQQALALHFLLTEALDVTNIDTTKLIGLAHLLAGKKIPVKDGHENIGNSGIKSAFGKMWQKESRRHVADLRFVLRFFKPFEETSSEVMQRAVKAIEREIAKTESRLNRTKDKD